MPRRPKPWRNVPPPTVAIAGVPIPRDLVAWIATELDGNSAGKRLAAALDNETRILGLDIDEREAVLAALEDPPAGLEELRAVLLQEHVGRVRDGLV